MAAIELMNGPLAGVIHEVEPGWPVPDRLALTLDGGHPLVVYWYKVSADLKTATFEDRAEFASGEKNILPLIRQIEELKGVCSDAADDLSVSDGRYLLSAINALRKAAQS